MPATQPVITNDDEAGDFYLQEGQRPLHYTGTHEEKTRELINKNWSAIRSYRKKWKFSNLYNVVVRNNNVASSLLDFDMRRILDDQANKFKINVSIGAILINNEDETMRYFHPSAGKDRLFDQPILITNREDYDAFVDKLLAEDLVEYSTRSRPDTSWGLHIITNINFFVYPIFNHPIGCCATIPSHLKSSKAVLTLERDTNGELYTDNLCLFRAIAMALGNKSTLQASTKAYFIKFLMGKSLSAENFKGVLLKDIPFIEAMLKISISVYTLKQSDSEGYVATLVSRSMTTYPNKVNLHLEGSHFCLIQNLKLYTKSYKCTHCNKLLKTASDLRVHSSRCSSETTKHYFPYGEYTPPKTIFQKLEQEGIAIPESLRYHPYYAVFDCEVFFTHSKNDLPNNSPTISWESKHNLASISVASNVAGFTQPVCFVRETDVTEGEIVQEMLKYLQAMSDHCYHKLRYERYHKIFRALERKKIEAVKLEIKAGNFEQMNFIQSIKFVGQKYDRLIKELDTYIAELMVFGFNSARYDLPLIAPLLIGTHISEKKQCGYVVKKGTSYQTLSLGRLKFLDVCNFIAPGFSYSDYLKAFEVEETKFFWIHEQFTSLKVLQRTDFPEHWEFYSSLKQRNITTDEYNHVRKIWEERKMKTLKDLLIYYNNCDCVPFVSALARQMQFFRSIGLDIKSAISIPGLSIRHLFNLKDSNSPIMMFGEQNKDLYYMIRSNIRGGLSMVFSRYQEVEKTVIKKEYYAEQAKTTQSVLGLDVSALYLNNLTNMPMPCGAFVRRRSSNDFKLERCYAYGVKAAQWIEWYGHQRGIKFQHLYNGGEVRLGGRNLPVDGYAPCKNSRGLVLQFLGCYFHSHCCTKCPVGREQNVERDAINRENTMSNVKYLEDLGYTVVIKWECEYDNELKSDKLQTSFCREQNIAIDNRHKLSEKQILQGITDGSFFGMVECDIMTPDELKPYFEEFQPIAKHAMLDRNSIGIHMKSFAEANKLLKKPSKTLLCSYYGNRILLATPLLQWYLSKGLVVTKIHQTIQFKPEKCFQKFGETVVDARREGDTNPATKVVSASSKLMGNSAYGNCLKNVENYRDVTYHKADETAIHSLINGKRFTHCEEINENVVEIEMAKKSVKVDIPIQVGFFVLEYAKLLMLRFYYDFLLKYISDRDFCLIQTDTDSLYFALSTKSLCQAVKPELRDEFMREYSSWFAIEYCDYHQVQFFETAFEGNTWNPLPCCEKVKVFDSRTPGKFHLEFKGDGVIALCSKSYYCIGKDPKLSTKGISKVHNSLTASNFKDVLFNQEISSGINKGFRVRDNTIYTYTQSRKGLNYMYGKRPVMSDHVTTTPTLL